MAVKEPSRNLYSGTVRQNVSQNDTVRGLRLTAIVEVEHLSERQCQICKYFGDFRFIWPYLKLWTHDNDYLYIY